MSAAGGAERPPGGRDLAAAVLFALGLCWKADRRRFAGIVAAQAVTALGLAAVVLLARDVLGAAVAPAAANPAGDGRLIPAVAAMAAAGSAGAVLRMVAQSRQRVLAAAFDRRATGLVLDRAVGADLAAFERPGFHDRLERAMFASRVQPMMLIGPLFAVLQAVLGMVAVGAAFAVMAWWLVPFAAAGMVPLLRASRRERDAAYGLHRGLAEDRRRREYLERLLTGLAEAKEVRSLGLGPELRRRWEDRYEGEIGRLTALYRRHLPRKVLARLAGDAITLGVIGAVWWLVLAGRLALPTALASLTALWLLSTRLQIIGSMLNNLGASVLYLRDLKAFAQEEAEDAGNAAEPGREAVASFTGVRAERVSFTYPGSAAPALREVSVDLEKGEIVALVGANGSGKSTLAKILAGLYPPCSGTVLLDGRPAPPDGLRRLSAVVFQDFLRYKLTAADNIAFGRPGEPAGDDGVRDAARMAGADGFVRRLPDGYGTVLSKEFSGGEDLSGGQWQKLAIARAFYRNAPFVILDEPTAALDPEAEEELFGRIRELFAGRTVLLISHRFSSVRGADRIYVLDRGAVVEHGTHAALMARDGTYARLFLTQAAGYLDAAAG
ncbi:ABC transporter ATP-binding protein [Actinomadura sp. 21ATH]|uniref:ABC transporter ATP-binding protein n=1 Tax=Actinomadura sp. 21ATH TaxID=1735444 RepID=UPI0035C11781